MHPVTSSNRKKKLKNNGAKAFGGDNELKEKEKKIANLERMVGQKEVEIALLRSPLSRERAFWARGYFWAGGPGRLTEEQIRDYIEGHDREPPDSDFTVGQ